MKVAAGEAASERSRSLALERRVAEVAAEAEAQWAIGAARTAPQQRSVRAVAMVMLRSDRRARWFPRSFHPRTHNVTNPGGSPSTTDNRW